MARRSDQSVWRALVRQAGRALCLCYLGGTVLTGAEVAPASTLERRIVMASTGQCPQPIVAVDDVCAWPNLTLAPDGTVYAAIHNQPSHLKRPADVDCWASTDGGRTWAKRGTAVPRDNERVARGNVAAGVARNGDLIAIASGWSDPVAPDRGGILPPVVSRSADGGRTWSVDAGAFPHDGPGNGPLVPFGDILPGQDGLPRVALYGGKAGTTAVCRSADDGRTWGEPTVVDAKAIIHEPALLHLGGGRWLLAARYDGLELYASDDDAKTWTHRQTLTGKQQHPGHFLRLRDGRILLSYGNRQDPKGVDVRVSADEGATWSTPFRVVDFLGDGGYPSSVQLPDGQVLTAYYAQRITGHDRYHMGVVRWHPDTLTTNRAP